MEFWTAIGTVASVLGAAVSIWQARRARSAAQQASRIRRELAGRREASELGSLEACCRRAQARVTKYGPAASPDSLRGIDRSADAGVVQEFVLLLREHRQYFGPRTPNAADELCSTVEVALRSFARAGDSEAGAVAGSEILLALSSFLPRLKRAHETKLEAEA